MSRKICIVTGSRADYGYLRSLARRIADDPDLILQWLATGSHYSEKFGSTYREIEADGFIIDEKFPVDLPDDTAIMIAHATGAAMGGVADALTRLAPDILVVLGDRYETLAAASAAMLLQIPIAHIHGGEVTEGAFDDAIRHAVTKMSHLHFVAAEPYRMRVIQMGENPATVFTVGTPGLDNLTTLEPMTISELETRVEHDLGEGFFLITYHPETLATGDPAAPVAEMFTALEAWPERCLLITGVNADPGHDAVAGAVADYAARRAKRVAMCASLGEKAYFSALGLCGAVVGNSSSGLIEAPAVGAVTVNIGDRQKGRLRARSVIDCRTGADSIRAAVSRALDPDFQAQIKDQDLPYGRGGASAQIKDRLKTFDGNIIRFKRFHDIPATEAHADG
jgi:UDP-hydrolysing UDP-N-acetyl-D-glucosamine 2-epimerase